MRRYSAMFRAVVFASIWLIADCRRQPPEDVWRESDPTYVPSKVEDIVVSTGNRFIGLTVDERPSSDKLRLASDFAVYILDLKTGNHRRLGMDGFLMPGKNDQLVYYESSRSSQPLVVSSGLETAMLQIAEHSAGWWNPKTGTMIVETGWPKDAEGFNTLGLLNLETNGLVSVPMRATSELVGICPATGNFYTEHRLPNDELGADEYSATGTFIRTISSPFAVFSAACSYVLPFASVGLHGPDDWGVYQASTGSKLMDFPWNEDGKSDLHWFRAWNPRHDNLLLMYSTAAATKMDTVDVLDVNQRRVLKSWLHPEGSPPIEWSSDGEAIVTVRDQHLIFEPLSLSKTASATPSTAQPFSTDSVRTLVQNEFGGVFTVNTHRLNQNINPPFVTGDFNGNGTQDLAVLVSVQQSELQLRLQKSRDYSLPALTIMKTLGKGVSAAEAKDAQISLEELAEFRESILLLILPDFGQHGPPAPRFALVDFCNNGDITLTVSRQPLRRAPAGDAPVTAPPKLRGDALLFLDSKHEGTAVYWDGTRYLWYPVE